jgi:phosphinothricin acetyltransferase
MDLCIRAATAVDLAEINAIYNHYVLHSTCTYQTVPSSEAERAAWFAAHGAPHPVIVAEREGAVVGWGSLSQFHPRDAYQHSVEDSVYVRHDAHGLGIGSALLAELLRLAEALGHHTVLGGIDAEQPASIALHGKHGFVEVARYREVGYKYGRWLDVVWMQRMV